MTDGATTPAAPSPVAPPPQQVATPVTKTPTSILPVLSASLSATERKVGIVTVLQYAERLTRPEENSIEHWRHFIASFHNPGAVANDDVVAKLALWNAAHEETRTFELTATTLARFYNLIFQTGVRNVALTLENPKEYFSTGVVFVDCPRASITYYMENDHCVIGRGHLRVSLTPTGEFNLWEFHARKHVEYIPRHVAGPSAVSASVDAEVNAYGVSAALLRYLEMCEVISFLSDVMSFSHAHGLGPLASLQGVVNSPIAEATPRMPEPDNAETPSQQHTPPVDTPPGKRRKSSERHGAM